MTVYKDIYAFQVIDEIKSGKDVYVIDKAASETCDAIVFAVDMSVCDFIEAIFNPNKENRFSFFEIVEENEESNK